MPTHICSACKVNQTAWIGIHRQPLTPLKIEIACSGKWMHAERNACIPHVVHESLFLNWDELLCTLAFQPYLKNMNCCAPSRSDFISIGTKRRWAQALNRLNEHTFDEPQRAVSTRKNSILENLQVQMFHILLLAGRPKPEKLKKTHFHSISFEKINLTHFRSGWVAGREIHFTNEKWIPSMNWIRHGLGNPQLTQSPILHTIEIIIRGTFCWKNLTHAQYILKNWSIYSSERSPQTCIVELPIRHN